MDTNNAVLLRGRRLCEPRWSHENHQTRFYRFELEIKRLSGQSDVLPVLLPEALLPELPAGERVEVRGQLRSFNNHSGVGSRLVLTVYAVSLAPTDEEDHNEIQLNGFLCKLPVYRRTPLGRNICDLMLAVPRRYARADYLPVITWGALAQQTGAMQVGDPLAVQGRVQSRVYHKTLEDGTVEDRVAYEVSVTGLLAEE